MCYIGLFLLIALSGGGVRQGQALWGEWLNNHSQLMGLRILSRGSVNQSLKEPVGTKNQHRVARGLRPNQKDRRSRLWGI